jgi:hypothetical protein
VKINIILADIGVQDASGKLNLLGAGWSTIGVLPNGLTSDIAIAVNIEVPWDQCNRELDFAIELVDEDSQPFQVPVGEEMQPLRLAQKLVVPTIPGAPNGTPGSHNVLLQLKGGLPLTPGRSYKWRAVVDGKEDEAGEARFYVLRQPSTPTFGAR